MHVFEMFLYLKKVCFRSTGMTKSILRYSSSDVVVAYLCLLYMCSSLWLEERKTGKNILDLP